MAKITTCQKTQPLKILFVMPKNCLKPGKYRELKLGKDREWKWFNINTSLNISGYMLSIKEYIEENINKNTFIQ